MDETALVPSLPHYSCCVVFPLIDFKNQFIIEMVRFAVSPIYLFKYWIGLEYHFINQVASEALVLTKAQQGRL